MIADNNINLHLISVKICLNLIKIYKTLFSIYKERLQHDLLFHKDL